MTFCYNLRGKGGNKGGPGGGVERDFPFKTEFGSPRWSCQPKGAGRESKGRAGIITYVFRGPRHSNGWAE